MATTIIDGLRFVLTCSAYPEQYDVFDPTTDEQVGYVRLRWGALRVDVPDCGGRTVLENGDEDVGFGDFDSDKLRGKWLGLAAAAIQRARAEETP
jgi:hypothetical protein